MLAPGIVLLILILPPNKKNAMRNRKDIICLSLPSWEGKYMKSTVHLMRRLAHTNNVLYVDYPFTLKDLCNGMLGRQEVPIKRMLGLSPRLRALNAGEGNHIHVLTLPPILPINMVPAGLIYTLLMWVNGMVARLFIQRAMRKLGMQKPVVVNAFNPFLGLPLVGKLKESRRIYYCYDEIGASNWVSRHGTRLERAYIKNSHAVITTSQGLFEKCSALHKNTVLIKNGVDFDLFYSAFEEKPADTETKCVGYLGNLNSRLDYDLLADMCRDAPEMRFLFVGQIQSEEARKKLGAFNNVEFTGPKSPDELPQFVRQMDVGIIPFRKNEQTRNIYPLKINEYLAAGKPVVMTDFAPLEEFKSIVEIEDKSVAFLKAIKEQIAKDDMAQRMRRVNVAIGNSWDQRTASFERVIRKVAA